MGVRIGFAIGKTLPPKLGYMISDWIAALLSHQRSSSLACVVRQNQYVVRNYPKNKRELDNAVKEVFTHAGHCFIDLYHSLGSQDRVLALVSDDEASREFIKLSKDPSFGAFIAVPHISNFDLCLQALAYRGVEGQVLTFDQPTGGYEIQNKIRAQTGLVISPISRSVIIQAIKRMQRGGFVFTGVDRPVQPSDINLQFFGRPSLLPTGYTRMAKIAGVPIIVASAFMDEKGSYHIHYSNPIPIQPHNNPDTEIQINGEAILKVIETRIRENPGQWLMYYPVWSDILTNN